MKPLATIFDVCARDNLKAGDTEGLKSVLDEHLPARERLQLEWQQACDVYASLARVKSEHEAMLKDATQKEHKQFAAVMDASHSDSAFDLTSAYETVVSLGVEREARQHVLDFINYVCLPAALDRKLEATRDLRRAEHLEASLYAALSHSTMLEKLEQAGVYQTHGRIVAVSETTSRLEHIAAEAHRQAQLADAALTASRTAQLTRTQQRHAAGQTTRAEAISIALELSRSTTTESTNN